MKEYIMEVEMGNAPITVQPLVRCKDCRYCNVGVTTAQYENKYIKWEKTENLCNKHKWSVPEDGYCYMGEMR